MRHVSEGGGTTYLLVVKRTETPVLSRPPAGHTTVYNSTCWTLLVVLLTLRRWLGGREVVNLQHEVLHAVGPAHLEPRALGQGEVVRAWTPGKHHLQQKQQLVNIKSGTVAFYLQGIQL